MTITNYIAKNIIKNLLKGKDYRIEVVNLINAEFLQFSIRFFKKVIDSKLKNKDLTIDWYKKDFLNPHLSSEEIAIHSGLNKKTIHNMFNSSKKEIVIDAAGRHYDEFYKSIKNLIDKEQDLELMLTIKFKSVSVDLNISESLIVINTLAVKRASLRGGLWSAAGKRVEKPLMQVLCCLYGVPKNNYIIKKKKTNRKLDTFEREVDFYLVNANQEYKCEVKLMGKGNPESADAVFARQSKIFIADKLSNTNKRQLDSNGIKWLELRRPEGFKKFGNILTHLNIPHKPIPKNIDKKIEDIFNRIFL